MGWDKRGSHKFICDRCRLEYHSDEKRKEWNGAVVCEECWEPRHELDFVRAIKEDTSVPDPRPEPDYVFVDGPACTIEQRAGIAGQGAAGCAVANFKPSLQ